MNKMLRTLALLAAFATGSTALLAQPAVKLVVVDISKAYEAYYKAIASNAKFQEARQKGQEQAEEIQKQGQTLVEEYKELVEQAKSSLLTAEAKAKAEQAVQKKYQEIQQKQADFQDFVQKTEASLQQQAMNRRMMLLDEITKSATEIATRKGATILLDKSGPSAFRIPVVLYSDAAYDITDEVVTEINKDRPATAAVAPATPAAPAAPAAGFTVPNVSGAKPEPAKKP